MILQVAGIVVSTLSSMADTLKPDLKRIVTPSAVAAVLTLSLCLWELELQGHTHTLCPSSEEDNDARRSRRELARFLVDSGEPMITLPKLSGASPHDVTRAVYEGAVRLCNLLYIIVNSTKQSDDLKDVVPDEMPLQKGEHPPPVHCSR